jgi:predicted alpha/beta superfamily hydrolase
MKEDFPHVARAVDALIRSGEIPPMLLVGIENTERRRDLTGPTEVESDRTIAPAVGGSEAFRGFISRELMPLIQTFYRVTDEASIIGESLAGLFVVETLFVQPGLFDSYIALDPSLWWNAQQWWREAGSRLDGMAGVQVRLLLASAGDSGDAADNLADALCRHPVQGLRWAHVPRPDLRHGDIFRSLEHSVLRQMFSGQELAAPDCTQDASD